MRQINTTQKDGLSADTIINYFDFYVRELSIGGVVQCSEAGFLLNTPKAQSTFVARLCSVLRDEYDIELKLDDKTAAQLLAAGIAAIGNKEGKYQQNTLILSRAGVLKLEKLINFLKRHRG